MRFRCFVVLMIAVLVYSNEDETETEKSSLQNPTCGDSSLVISTTEQSMTLNLTVIGDRDPKANSYEISVTPNDKPPEIVSFNREIYTINDLEPATNYSIDVKMFFKDNESGIFIRSQHGCATWNYTSLKSPTCGDSLLVISTTEQSMTLNLTVIGDRDPKANSYEIGVTPNDKPPEIVSFNSEIYTINDLEPATNYSIDVKMLFKDNESGISIRSQHGCTTWNYTSLKSPTCSDSSLVISTTEQSMTLNLTVIGDRDPKANSYEISVRPNDKPPEIVSFNSEIYTITDLEPATNYSIDVKMFFKDNESGISIRSQHGCTTWNYTSLKSPYCGDNSLVITRTEQSMTLNLTVIGDRDPKANSYEISVTPNDKPPEIVSFNSEIYTIHDLEPATNYSIDVKMFFKNNENGILIRSQHGCTTWNYTSLKSPTCGDSSLVTTTTEKSMTLNLTVIGDRDPKANSYEISVTPNDKPPEIVSFNRKMYTINDLEPATNYSIDVKMFFKDNESGISIRSQHGCTTWNYTRPVLKCILIEWPKHESTRDVVVTIPDKAAPKAEGYYFSINTLQGESSILLMVQSCSIGCAIALFEGSNNNISVAAIAGPNMTSTPCVSPQIKTNPADPNCNDIIKKSSADEVTIDLSKVHTNGAERYRITMTYPYVKQHGSISPLGTAEFGSLHAGTLYVFNVFSEAHNNEISVNPCNLTVWTRPNNPECNRNLWTSSNNSITIDLKFIATDDTAAHFVTPEYDNQTAIRVPNNDTVRVFEGLLPGQLQNFSLISIGHDNQTSAGMCVIHAYTRPNNPLCDQFKVTNTSIRSLGISLGAQESEGATGYRVMIHPNNATILLQKQFSYLFQKLTPGTLYQFTLHAVSLNNMTSKEHCTAAKSTVPAKPGKITVITRNEFGFKIQWVKAEGNVDKYDVNVTCDCRQQKNHCNPTVRYDPKTMADINGTVPGTHCNVSVKAISHQLQSCAREIWDIETNETHSGKVQNVKVDNISSKSVNVRWDPPSEPNGDITSYTVYRLTKENLTTSKNQTTEFSFVIQGLTAGICYIIKIAANNKAGEGDPECVNVYTTEQAPEQVVGLNATVDTSRSLNISWQKPNVTNGVIQSYTVQVLTGNQCVHEIMMYCSACKSGCPYAVSSAVSQAKGQTSLEKSCNKTSNITFSNPLMEDFKESVDHLLPFTNYTIQVYASTSAGAGKFSFTTEKTSEENPSIVTNLKTLPINGDSVTVSFNKPNAPNGIILKYIIEYQHRSHSSDYCADDSTTHPAIVDYAVIDMPSANSSQASISHTINGLYPYWQYSIRVIAGNKAGNSSWTDILNVTTLSMAPGLVTSVAVSNIEAKSFLVSWKKPCFPNGIIDIYNVLVLDTNVVVANITTIEQKFNAEKLLPYQNYTYRIKGHTEDGGWGDTYNSGKIRTLTDVPNPPKDVKGHPVSSKSVKVNWTAPQHETGNTSYTVWAVDKETQQNASSCETIGFLKTSCLIEKLDEYWNYTLLLVATTVNGSTKALNTPVVRTFEDAPGEIQDLTISVENDTTKPRRVNITWDKPSLRNQNGKLKNFYVEYSTPGKVLEIKKIRATELSLDNLDVVAGKKYTFKVYAETIKNGTIVQKTSGIIPMGAPPLIPQLLIQTGPTGIISNDEKQLSIYLQKEYLCNNTNGQPDDWGIIVSQDSETGNTKPYRGSKTGYEAEKKKRYKTWSQVHDNDKMDPYIASKDFNPKCSGKRRKREASNSVINFIVGSDGDCDSSKDFCNGYLKPGKTYRVRTWSCTDGGCVESEYSTPLFTEPNRVPLIAGVTSTCIVVIFVGVVGLFIYLRRRQRGPSRKKNGKDSGHSNEGFDRAGEDVEMHKKGKAPRPVRLTDFSNHVGRMHGDSDLLFREEYEIVKNTCARHPATVAEGQGARTKNRYTNILAYDHSRVKLLPTDDEDGSDYINANYIPGYNGQREFIATQGPQASTIDDFWRMIWEQSVTTIVMLTQLVERGRRKCDQYWPGKPFEPVFHGDIVVELTSESTLPNYMLREFALKLGDVTRKVKHFQYLDWPDMGTPETSDSMIGFVRSVRSHVPVTNKGPIVVHCSAGVGRTGTFIAVDHLIHHVKQHDTIDIYGLVMNLRNNRNNMVQTEDQYVFIHDCMNDFINNDDDESDEAIYENA